MTANPSLIDTMARAIAQVGAPDTYWDGLAEWQRDDYRKDARAALQALLEAGPTEAMLKAMHDAIPLCDRARCDNVREVARAENLPKFSAAMRAALEEAGK